MDRDSDGRRADRRGAGTIGAGIAIGAGLGVALGTVLGNLALGIAIGVTIGTTMGVALGAPPGGQAMRGALGESASERTRLGVLLGLGVVFLLVTTGVVLWVLFAAR
jgi:hypothetical protein